MEKNSKEHADKHKKQRSTRVLKVLLLTLSLIVVVQFALVAKGFASLEALSSRLTTLEENSARDKALNPSENHEPGPRRSKRTTDKHTFQKAMLQLRKIEERFNKSYQYLGSKHVFLLSGPPGKPGTPGLRGKRGPAGPKGDSRNVGVTYIRWGKKTCPSTGAALVYKGYVGGSKFRNKGGGSNYVCLTRNPIYEKYQPGLQSYFSRIYGAEYQSSPANIFPANLNDHDVPCAVCHVTKRASQMMIPGRNLCPTGWTREYKGYLMAERHDHYRTMYTCVDENPDYKVGSKTSLNGVLFYFVEGVCGSLPCRPYIEGRELTCAVCTR